MTPWDPQEVLVVNSWEGRKGGREEGRGGGVAGPEGVQMTSTPGPFGYSPDVAERT